MALTKTKFNPSFPLVDKQGRPTILFAQYMAQLDALALFGGSLNQLVNAANDGAAAAAGVAVGSAYRNGSVLQIRVT
jgi:hypothetical protein